MARGSAVRRRMQATVKPFPMGDGGLRRSRTPCAPAHRAELTPGPRPETLMPAAPASLLALAFCFQAPARDSLPPPRTVPELEARIREVLTGTRTPGIGIAIVSRDSDLWVAGLGTADVATGRGATAETLFRIGSTSKAFVSLLVL